MRFYMSKKERDEIKGLIYSFEVILNDINSSTEEKQAAEYQIVSLSGILLSPLFPTGIFRNILMISFFALGFLAFLTPYEWLFWSFFIALAFSPRIVGRVLGTQYLILEFSRYVKAGKDCSTWVSSPRDATGEPPSGCVLL